MKARAARSMLLSMALASCSLAGPVPSVYVLGEPPSAPSSTVPLTGMPVVLVRRVSVPEYLDTADLVTRRGRQIVPSVTGRWGERLSLGLTAAIVAALSAQLPGVLVTASPIGTPARRVVAIDVQRFEAEERGPVLLQARWTITDATGRAPLGVWQSSIAEPVSGTGDAAIVDAMSAAANELARRIAQNIERGT